MFRLLLSQMITLLKCRRDFEQSFDRALSLHKILPMFRAIERSARQFGIVISFWCGLSAWGSEVDRLQIKTQELLELNPVYQLQEMARISEWLASFPYFYSVRCDDSLLESNISKCYEAFKNIEQAAQRELLIPNQDFLGISEIVVWGHDFNETSNFMMGRKNDTYIIYGNANMS